MIKEGDNYTTHGGLEARIMVINDSSTRSPFPVKGVIKKADGDWTFASWTLKGRYMDYGDDAHDLKLPDEGFIVNVWSDDKDIGNEQYNPPYADTYEDEAAADAAVKDLDSWTTHRHLAAQLRIIERGPGLRPTVRLIKGKYK